MTPGPSTIQQKILQVKAENPNLTVRQIAAIADCTHPHVIATLQRYGVNQHDLKAYKDNRADILAGMQQRVISAVTDADVKKASLYQKITAAAILMDKERLERGQASEIIDHRHLQVDLAQALRAMREGAYPPIDAEVIEPDMGTSLGVSE